LFFTKHPFKGTEGRQGKWNIQGRKVRNTTVFHGNPLEKAWKGLEERRVTRGLGVVRKYWFLKNDRGISKEITQPKKKG